MINYHELMTILSVPRPNGSAAERETGRALQDWLTRHSIPHRVQKLREALLVWLGITENVDLRAFLADPEDVGTRQVEVATETFGRFRV